MENKQGSNGSQRVSASKKSSGAREQVEMKSIGAIISQSLAQGGQESVDQALSQVGDWMIEAKDYVQENPREAIAIAAAVGLSAWALFATKPGRRIFESGAGLVMPEISKWLSGNRGAVKH